MKNWNEVKGSLTSLTEEEIKELKDLQKRFTYQPPKVGQPERYTHLREVALGFAMVVLCECPNSREKSLAMTKIEEAVMWAIAAIARNE